MVIRSLRKNSTTLTGLVMAILIVMVIFTGSYLWWESSVSSAGVTFDTRYNESYNRLNTTRDSLSDNVNDIRDNVQAIKEADDIYQVAWNGLKGLGNTLKLPVSFLDTALETFSIMTGLLDFVPGWIITLTVIGLTAFIVFLVLSLLKGEPRL